MVIAYLTQKSNYWYKRLWTSCFQYLEKTRSFPKNNFQRLVVTWFVSIVPMQTQAAGMRAQANWPTSTLIRTLRPVTDNLDFVSILEKVENHLKKVSNREVLFSKGNGSDRLVVWLLIHEASVEQKVWIRLNGEVSLYEEGLEIRCQEWRSIHCGSTCLPKLNRFSALVHA